MPPPSPRPAAQAKASERLEEVVVVAEASQVGDRRGAAVCERYLPVVDLEVDVRSATGYHADRIALDQGGPYRRWNGATDMADGGNVDPVYDQQLEPGVAEQRSSRLDGDRPYPGDLALLSVPYRSSAEGSRVDADVDDGWGYGDD